MFVAFEGLDGVGKSSLVRELARHYDGVHLDTPGSELSPLVDKLLDAFGEHQTARCLFYAASVLKVGQTARRLSDAGETVFVDRYWLSTVSYARARGVTIDLSALEEEVPAPDLTVLVILEEKERRQRIYDRGVDQYDLDTLSQDFSFAVLQEMRSVLRRFVLRPIELDVTGYNRDDAVEQAWRLISRRLL